MKRLYSPPEFMHVASTARYAGQVAQKTNCSLVVDDISTSLPDNGLKTAIRRIIAHSGIEDFSFHDRRHTVLTPSISKSEYLRSHGHGRFVASTFAADGSRVEAEGVTVKEAKALLMELLDE